MTGIERTRDGRIVTVTLQRPEKRNALSRALVRELTRIFEDLDTDDSVRVIVLTGAGGAFSAGADLKALEELRTAGFDENLEDSRALAHLFLSMKRCGKVIIGRVNGHAIAGGCGLVAACDLAYGVEGAKFGFTEVRIGFVPALVSVLLKGRVQDHKLRDLFLTGRLIDARAAVGAGLLNDAVSMEELDGIVDRTARDIARNTSGAAIRTTKRMLVDMAQPSLEKALDKAASLNAEARESADCKAGVDSFLSGIDAPWVRQFDRDNGEPA